MRSALTMVGIRWICVACALVLCLLQGAGAVIAQGSGSGSGSGEHSIRLGYLASMLAEVDRSDAKVALQVWTDNLSKEEGYNYTTFSEIYESLDEMVQALKDRKIDMVSISALDYLRIRDKVSLIPEICSAWNDSPFAVELLLVRKDSGITSFKQLAGRTLLIEKLATGGLPMIWLDTLLWKNGLPEHTRFCGKVKLVDKSSAAAMPVFFKQADACIVRETSFNSIVELNPQVGNDLVAIERSPKCLRAFALFRSDYNETDRKRLERSALKLHQTVKGKQILMLFKTEKIIDYDPAFIKTTEDLWAEYHKLKVAQKRP